ncbi:MAG: RNA-binding protein [Robiginitomaculum sp.]|nr:MAG: RNA-binding protein [Robiginitomaculum sp.]
MATKTAEAETSLRLDIWLWRARFFKSRALSARAIRLKRIRLERNGQTLRVFKPHTLVRAGDQLVFMRAEHLVHIEVVHMGTRRGPAPEARTLYCDVQSQTGESLRA